MAEDIPPQTTISTELVNTRPPLKQLKFPLGFDMVEAFKIVNKYKRPYTIETEGAFIIFKIE